MAGVENISIRRLCMENTDLSDTDIKFIGSMATGLKTFANLADADIFIDCPTKDGDTIVVAEANPDYVESSYKNTVVGLLAKSKDEPAVARTLRLGVATKQMKARTQENTHVIQTVEPIKNNNGRVIAVLVQEKMADELQVSREHIHLSQDSSRLVADAITHMAQKEENWLTDVIDEALVIIGKDGRVSACNSLAVALYKKLGYEKDLLGQPYSNVTQIYPEMSNVKEEKGFVEFEVDFAGVNLVIRRIDINTDDTDFALIIKDVTEIKAREKELVLKAVAVEEMHHRVKNNLNTIASLLRLQSRRTRDHEAQKILHETMNRILSIAITHELLSRVGVDNVSIQEVVEQIRNNALRYSSEDLSDMPIDVTVRGDNFLVSSMVATHVAMVVNELLQNSLNHAFSPKEIFKNARQKAFVDVIIRRGNLYSSIEVCDNGVGFDVTKTNSNDTLGLGIVQTLVKERLEGKLNITSSKDGTAVIFDFKNI